MNVYVSPSISEVDSFYTTIQSADLIGGDINAYTSKPKLGRCDLALNKFLDQNDFISLGFFYTFQSASNKNSSPILANGPDHFIAKSSTNIDFEIEKGDLAVDHFGLLCKFLLEDFDNSVLVVEQNLIGKWSFDYKRVNSEVRDSIFDKRLTKESDIDSFFGIWEDFLKISRKKFLVRADTNASELDFLANLGSDNDIADYFENWARESNSVTTLGDVHKIINFLKDRKEDTAKISNCPSFSDKINRKSKEASFNDFKENVQNPVTLKRSFHKRAVRIKKWWSRICFRNSLIKFKPVDILDALRKLNKKSVGIDHIPITFMPQKPAHLEIFTKAINDLLFGDIPFHRKMNSSRINFVPKTDGSGKLRTICICNRFDALLEHLVSGRLMSLVKESKQFNNRFGFITNRSIDDLQALLLDKIQSNRSQKLKTGFMSLDMSKAYDKCNHIILLIKVKKLVSDNGHLDLYAIIVGFTIYWLKNRSTTFKSLKTIIRSGLPQGSPYSCLCFIVYFDFDGSLDNHKDAVLDLYFADDIDFVVSAKNWDLVELIMIEIYDKFERWCAENCMLVNQTKTVICFFDRRKYNSDFPLAKFRVASFRCLGFYLDERLSFAPHVANVLEFLAKRATLIRRLHFTLGISSHVLLRICMSFRMKIFFSTWYLLFLSKSQLKALNAAFGRLIRNALGLCPLVPFQAAHDFCGVSSFNAYLDYWLCLRSFEASITGKIDFFDKYKEFKDKALNQNTSTRSTRNSTKSSTLESVLKSNGYFTDLMMEKLDVVMRHRGNLEMWFFEGGGNFKNKSYKLKLKSLLLDKIIDKNTVLKDEIKKINDKFGNLYGKTIILDE